MNNPMLFATCLFFLRDLFLVSFSSLLLVLSFPNFDHGFLAWVGLVPLFAAIHAKSSWRGFFLSFLWGAVFMFGVFIWMREVDGFRVIHHIPLLFYMGLFYGFFGALFCFIQRRLGAYCAFLAAPFLWVSLEFLRANLSFLALPWALLAQSQYLYLPIIQVASVAGAYGISFLIVMVNSTFALTLLVRLQSWKHYSVPVVESLPEYGLGTLVLATSILAAVTLVYGQVVLSEPIQGQGVAVSIVQGNIPQRMKWNKRVAKFVMERYRGLTGEVSKNAPDLIVWPETATPAFIGGYPALRDQVAKIAEEASAPILTGSAEHQKLERKESSRTRMTNSAFLIHPSSRMEGNQRYDKIRLLPFGEYLPLKGSFIWSYLNVPNIRDYAPGKAYTVFDLKACRFATPICWENLFPDLIREFVRSGAQFIVNITNEAHFKKTAAPRQFLSASVLRAVENRVFVIRCANTGISCFIDPHGRVVGRVKDEKGEDLFVSGVLTRTIIPLDSRTVYTVYGEWLAWLSAGVAIVFLFAAILRKNPNPRR